MKSNIKPANYWAIFDFVMHKDNSRIHGIKLQALCRLIEKKGFPIIGLPRENEFKAAKALQISDTEFLAINITHLGKEFFPCKIKTILMQKL